MKPIQGYHLIAPQNLSWQTARLMKIPNADFLERTGSENLSARFWRYPPKSAGTLHKHVRQEEFYFVLEGTGRMRVGDETLTVPRHGGVLVGPDQLRQVQRHGCRSALAHHRRTRRTGIPSRRKDETRPVTHLSDRPDAIAQGTRWRAMAAEGVMLAVPTS